jgi:serine/threonine protein phosphatase PrpC
MANVMGNAHELSKQAYSLILKDAIKSADKKLFQKGRGNGFLTTATVMLQTPWGETVVANAGDSRAYVMRKGKLMPLTKDNAYGAVFDGPLSGDETYPQRVISEMEFTNDNTDPNIRHAFHHRNLISSYLGIGMSDDASAISITYFMPQPGDIVLLTTDGVHDNLKDSEIEKIVHDNSVKAADELALLLTNNAHATSKKDRTLSHRPKSDDMTAVVVKY